jgi:hypothetical protein
MTPIAPRTTPATTAIHELPTAFPALGGTVVLVLVLPAALLALVDDGGAVVRVVAPVEADDPELVVEVLPVAEPLWLVESELAETVVDEDGGSTVGVVASAGGGVVVVVVSAVGIARALELVFMSGQQGKVEGIVARWRVPLYCGHPGTSVFGGARPPPQSRKSHSSPVLGS